MYFACIFNSSGFVVVYYYYLSTHLQCGYMVYFFLPGVICEHSISHHLYVLGLKYVYYFVCVRACFCLSTYLPGWIFTCVRVFNCLYDACGCVSVFAAGLYVFVLTLCQFVFFWKCSSMELCLCYNILHFSPIYYDVNQNTNTWKMRRFS